MKSLILFFLFLNLYNSFSQNDTIFLDDRNNICPKSVASYFRIITKQGKLYSITNYHYPSKNIESIFFCKKINPLKITGKYESWYKNGVKKEFGFYSKNMQNGLFTHWDTLGFKTSHGKKKNTKRIGIWKFWEEFEEDSTILEISKKDSIKFHHLSSRLKKLQDAGIKLVIDRPANYPGGKENLNIFLKNNFKKPENDIKNRTTGSIKIKFIISKDGEILDNKLLGSISESMDKAILDVISLMPKSDWQPAIKDFRYVKSIVLIPIHFTSY